MDSQPPTIRKHISLRKITVLGLLNAKNASGEAQRPINGRTRMQKLVFLVQADKRVRQVQGQPDTALHFDYQPIPEKFGPADLELYQDLEFLQAMGLLSINGSKPGPTTAEPNVDDLRASTKINGRVSLPEEEQEDELSFDYLMGQQPEELYSAEAEEDEFETVYEITKQGSAMLQMISAGLGDRDRAVFDDTISACSEIRSRFGDLPLKSLLRYVYENFSEFTGRSTIKDKVLRR